MLCKRLWEWRCWLNPNPFGGEHYLSSAAFCVTQRRNKAELLMTVQPRDTDTLRGCGLTVRLWNASFSSQLIVTPTGLQHKNSGLQLGKLKDSQIDRSKGSGGILHLCYPQQTSNSPFSSQIIVKTPANNLFV